MRAWRFHEFGDIGNFQLEDTPMPERGPDEVLIKLEHAALNPADRLLIEGKYPGAGALPLTVGRDGSGVVETAPPDSGFNPGDRVVVLRSEIGITRQGTLAEYVTAPVDVVAPLPDGWSFEEGAAAPLVYLTAWKALVTQGGLSAGESILVTGATGGVGIASIQLGKALGARVVALSRNAEKRERLLELGADIALDDGAPDLSDAIVDACGGKGPDIVIEHLGGPRLREHIAVANLNGRIMVIGLLAGRKAEIDLGPVLFKQVRIEGVHVGKYAPAEARESWTQIVAALNTHNARPVIDRVFAMDEVQAAFAHLAGGHLGKVVVHVASD